MADPVKLAEHVKDNDIFELPFQTHISIPQPFEAIGLKLHLTKFMVLELVAARADAGDFHSFGAACRQR